MSVASWVAVRWDVGVAAVALALLAAVVKDQSMAVIRGLVRVKAIVSAAAVADWEMAFLNGAARMSGHCCGSCALTPGPATSGPIPMCRLA
jgi:hypothetical protein